MTSTQTRSAPDGAAALSRFQPEIQGLRAVAVLLVVLYHLWPERLTGGFVGVDVFFVISGFLITAHIFREVSDTGRLGLLSFWARRIRRLLPLSFLVLAASIVMAVLVLPATVWDTTFRQVIASSLYVQNWILAADAVDYSAMDESATVVQHFWSLSVEEQFYIVWPLLLAGLLLLARRRHGRHGRATADPRRILLVGLLAVGLASFAWSIIATATNPATAYFVTPTRMWEFVVGALVAVGFLGRQFRGVLGNLVGWAGVAMIVVSGVSYTSGTPFPGHAALLPVVGTGLAILCGSATPWIGVHWWLSLPFSRFLGDISYGMYLWHWPLIVAVPFMVDGELRWWHKLAILGITIVLSWLSKIYVEDPFRIRPWLKRPVRSYGFAAVGMAVLAVASLLLPIAVAKAEQGPTLEASDQCYGAAALANGCEPVEGSMSPNPTPAKVALQAREPAFPDCQAEEDDPEIASCDIGVPAEESAAVVAIVGDSHATAWLPALEALAERHNWTVRTYTRSGCTPSIAAQQVSGSGTQSSQSEICTDSVRALGDRIAQDDAIKTVFTAASPIDRKFTSSTEVPLDDPTTEGFTQLWRQWLEAGKEVVAINEIPRLGGINVPTCVEENSDDVLECAIERDKAFDRTGNVKNAAAEMDDPNFRNVDVTDGFCDDTRCYPVVGTVITYYDKSHVSVEYARTLAPVIERQLDGLSALQP